MPPRGEDLNQYRIFEIVIEPQMSIFFNIIYLNIY